MTEIWKNINGYEGLYQISNLGRVKSLERRVRNNKNGGERIVKEALLNPTDNGKGYKIIGLRKNAHRKNYYIHRLVAENFLKNDENKKYVNHLDYDTTNNVVTNLEWCTQKENIRYSVAHMKKPRTKCKPTNTGEKYIIRIILSDGSYSYRVCISTKKIDKSFKSLDDAIAFRNEVIIQWQNQ